MDKLFLELLNRSLAAGIIVLVILALRVVVRKSPRKYFVMLWALVAVRLLAPFHIESPVSLIPSAAVLPEEIVTGGPARLETGFEAIDEAINPVFTGVMKELSPSSTNPAGDIIGVLSVVWLCGAALMLVYAFFSWLRIYLKVRASVPAERRVRICDYIDGAFILGAIRPVIYLPSGLEGEEREYILEHERAHLSRGDHLIKPFGYLILSFFWFNPLVWAGYIFLCRDVEYACDEKVLTARGKINAKAYAETLLRFSISRSPFTVSPLAFAEAGVKERIKRIMNYKKPAIIAAVVIIVAGIATAVCFLTDPARKDITDTADSSSPAQTAEAAGTDGFIIVGTQTSKKEISEISFTTDAFDTVVEPFWEDEEYVYSFGGIMSPYCRVTYIGGEAEALKDALSSRHIDITDLDRFGISYYKDKKRDEETALLEDIRAHLENLIAAMSAESVHKVKEEYFAEIGEYVIAKNYELKREFFKKMTTVGVTGLKTEIVLEPNAVKKAQSGEPFWASAAISFNYGDYSSLRVDTFDVTVSRRYGSYSVLKLEMVDTRDPQTGEVTAKRDPEIGKVISAFIDQAREYTDPEQRSKYVEDTFNYLYRDRGRGDVKDVHIEELASNVFTQDDYKMAVDAAITDFYATKEGLRLLEIGCITENDRDPVLTEYFAHPEKYMLLRGSWCEQTGGMADSIYTDWIWIMEKNVAGGWDLKEIGKR
ncbi:MAG: hypothetical protein IJS22_01630 [Lachnospiraceae bacterium]|nr:hypothetical protein [Lachnospiraceae bacterium]